MSNTYRVGVIGFAHMHINSLVQHFAAHSQVEMVACADTAPLRPELREARYTRDWNRKQALNEYGVPQSYDDYREMLDQEEFDIIISCAENARHGEVTAACASNGIHVVVEKPMAASLSEALGMVRAVQAAGTTLLINWPVTWSGAIRKAKSLIDDGAIGRVIEVKWRGGHLGPLGSGVTHPGVTEGAAPMTGVERGATWWHQSAPGGGAMLDYCCYGALLSRWYIGEQAQAAMGMKANLNSPWGDAEDNAAVLVRFPQAMAIFEGSWTTLDHGVSPGPIVYGTEGTLVIERKGNEMVRLERGGGDSTTYAGEALPEGRQTIAEEFIHHLETGDPVHTSLDMMYNLDVMAILDAGVRSAASGKMETVDNAVWRIG